MKVEPEDRLKLVGLIVAIVAVIGFAVRTVMQTISANKGSTTQSQPTPTPDPVAAAQPATAGTTPSMPGSTPSIRAIGYNGVNPFRMTVNPKVMGEAEPNKGQSPVSTTNNVQGKPGIGAPREMPGIVDDGTFNPTGNPDGQIPPVQPEAPMISAKLEGVMYIRGVKVAMLLQGESSLLLKVGHEFGAGFVLSAINDDSIELTRGSEKLTVKVGDQVESAPPKMQPVSSDAADIAGL